MKLWLVTRKYLVEIWREPKLLALVVLLPLAFLAITALGYKSPMLVTHPVLVITTTAQGETLIAELAAQRYADGRPVFAVTRAHNTVAAEEALKNRTATMLLSITPLLAITPVESVEGLPHIIVRGDPLHPRFYRASVMLDTLLYRYAEQMSGRPEVIKILEQPIVAQGPQTEFDLYAPGMIIFALLLLIPQTAMLVAREIRWNTLRRLRLTPLRAWELLSGIGLAQMVVAVLMVVLVFGAAILLGYNNQGQLWLAILVGLAVSFSSVGLGLLVACFIENDSQAINVGSAVTMTQVFLSGAFYQFPSMTLFVILGHQIDLFDIIPATHGFLALQQVLSYGANFQQISFRLTATLVLSIVYLIMGIVFFQHLKMKERYS
jgi:ABC-2 type transport system permease protein